MGVTVASGDTKLLPGIVTLTCSEIGIFQPQRSTKFLDALSHTPNTHANAATLKLREAFANPLPVVAVRDNVLAVLVLESNPPIPGT